VGYWRDAAEKRVVDNVSVFERNHIQELTFSFSLHQADSVVAYYMLTYRIDQQGRIMVEAAYDPVATQIPLLPKFGMRMGLSASFTQVEWYGRGPVENYPDRKHSQFIGQYSASVRDFEYDYIRPQDNANRCDTRWFRLSDGKSQLTVKGCQPLCFRVWDYKEEQLERAAHPSEIEGNYVNVNIDLNIHGVGGADTWGKRTLPQYTLPGTQPYRYSYILEVE